MGARPDATDLSFLHSLLTRAIPLTFKDFMRAGRTSLVAWLAKRKVEGQPLHQPPGRLIGRRIERPGLSVEAYDPRLRPIEAIRMSNRTIWTPDNTNKAMRCGDALRLSSLDRLSFPAMLVENLRRNPQSGRVTRNSSDERGGPGRVTRKK
jgi:hypothetical protein